MGEKRRRQRVTKELVDLFGIDKKSARVFSECTTSDSSAKNAVYASLWFNIPESQAAHVAEEIRVALENTTSFETAYNAIYASRMCNIPTQEAAIIAEGIQNKSVAKKPKIFTAIYKNVLTSSKEKRIDFKSAFYFCMGDFSKEEEEKMIYISGRDKIYVGDIGTVIKETRIDIRQNAYFSNVGNAIMLLGVDGVVELLESARREHNILNRERIIEENEFLNGLVVMIKKYAKDKSRMRPISRTDYNGTTSLEDIAAEIGEEEAIDHIKAGEIQRKKTEAYMIEHALATATKG